MVSRRGVRLFRTEQPIVLFSKFVPVGVVDLGVIERSLQRRACPLVVISRPSLIN